MRLTWYFFVGIIAAICIAVYMMPQLIKIIKTKDTNSVSIAMVLLAVFGDLCFAINGIGVLADAEMNMSQRLSAGLPIFLANLFGMTISAIILFFKIRNMQWAKKFNIKEDQIPAHYREIKQQISKAKFDKRLAKNQEKEKLEQAKKETSLKNESEDKKIG